MTSRYRRKPRRRWPRIAAPLTDIGAALDDAACIGMAPLFDLDVFGEDPEQREARHHRGVGVCRVCPVMGRCSAAAENLGDQAQGIWAGHLRTPTELQEGVSCS
ncbi:WhiB family transcriptional regulator [Nocardia sp. NBC_00881]|uniref:WhiB family transcriptional regulator n=1 Tax=Nocardia sp. NBC_00881 TaxID=2975995 RepID=UPI00386A77BA